MVQQFENSFKFFWKQRDKYSIIALILISYVLINLFKLYPLSKREEANQLLNNIIQFSAIFSAILITFIVSKVIQIRQERVERLKKIIELSNKLTDFRRIARSLKDSFQFWNSDMKQTLDYKYKDLNYFDMRSIAYKANTFDDELDKLLDSYYKEKNICGASLYLGVKSFLFEESHVFQDDLYDNYDHDYAYTLDILEKWVQYKSANILWICFNYNWAEYETCFDFSAITKRDQEEIIQLCQKINPKKYTNRVFDRSLLADIGSEVNENILPKLYNLTYYNSLGLPEALNLVLNTLMMTVISGVLTPLLLTSVKLGDKIVLNVSIFSSFVLILSLLYFLFSFKEILKREIQIHK